MQAAGELSFFLQGAVIGVGAALSPGPFQSLVITESLLGGWKRAVPVTFAPLLADIPIAAVLVFVIGQTPQLFIRFIHFAGAGLLVAFAGRSLREIRAGSTSNPTASTQGSRARRGFFQGVLMLFLSPGSYLFWALVLGPLLLAALGQSLAHAVAFLFGFYLLSIAGLQLIAFILGRLGQFSARGRIVLQYASLLLMLVIAGLLVTRGIRT